MGGGWFGVVWISWSSNLSVHPFHHVANILFILFFLVKIASAARNWFQFRPPSSSDDDLCLLFSIYPFSKKFMNTNSNVVFDFQKIYLVSWANTSHGMMVTVITSPLSTMISLNIISVETLSFFCVLIFSQKIIFFIFLVLIFFFFSLSNDKIFELAKDVLFSTVPVSRTYESSPGYFKSLKRFFLNLEN